MNQNYKYPNKIKENSPKEKSHYTILSLSNIRKRYNTLKTKAPYSEQIQSKYNTKYQINTYNPLSMQNYQRNKETSPRKKNHLSIYISDMNKTLNNKSNIQRANIKQSNDKKLYQLPSRLNSKNNNKSYICEKFSYNKKEHIIIKTTKDLNKKNSNNKHNILYKILNFKKKD